MVTHADGGMYRCGGASHQPTHSGGNTIPREERNIAKVGPSEARRDRALSSFLASSWPARYGVPAPTYSDMTNEAGDVTPDEILMAAYQAGNEPAFVELFDRYAGPVYGFLVRRLSDRGLAEDLYQEAFLRLHRARHTYDSTRPFRAWLFGIVHNLLADELRRRHRMPEVTTEELQGDGSVASRRHDIASESQTPESLVAARQSSAALSRALTALPSDEATVLILARIEGMSYEDIGRLLGRSAAATKQLAYRALNRVRAKMVADGHEEEP